MHEVSLVPLWGSKNEMVAPKWRTQNTFFEFALELVLKFAILVPNFSTKMACSQDTLQRRLNLFFQNTLLAHKSVLHLATERSN